MDITDDMVAEVAVNALEAFADNGRAQMTYMEGLCHIGAAVVHHHSSGIGVMLQTVTLGLAHVGNIVLQVFSGDMEVQKTWVDGRDLREHGLVLQLRCHGVGNLDGSAAVGLCRRHGAVALVFAQVGAVGYGNFAVRSIVTGIGKGLRYPCGNQINKFFHRKTSFVK